MSETTSSLHCSAQEWVTNNTVSVRAGVSYHSGEPLFRFSTPDGRWADYEDPLPEEIFNRLSNWVLREGEELEITIRRFPPAPMGGSRANRR